ncbi:MAG: GNAT family N-acetyltransferase [Thermodesulfovibrionales bacterium]|nr:GNAT family N-acetyltransferase [Thermodesulfovibrionales bacterium]
MSEVIFRKYRIGDEHGLTLLAKTVWGKDFSEDYWRWKFIENPARKNFANVAEWNGEIIGFAGYVPWQMTVMGTRVVAALYADLMVHPEWRKKNIFFPLNRKSRNEIRGEAAFHFGFSSEISFKIFRKRFKYMGFYPCKMQRFMNTISLFKAGVKKMKSAKVRDVLSIVPRVFSLVAVRSAGSKQFHSNVSIKRIESFDARFDGLWEKMNSSLGIATIRDSEYLNWRYTRNPANTYGILSAESEGQLVGFIVLRCERKEDITRGLIIDMLVEPYHEASITDLLLESLKYFQEQNARVVAAWTTPQNPLHAYLSRNGFSSAAAEKSHVFVDSLSPDLNTNYLCDINHWYFTMGDCDAF